MFGRDSRVEQSGEATDPLGGQTGRREGSSEKQAVPTGRRTPCARQEAHVRSRPPPKTAKELWVLMSPSSRML